jgi:nucleotide-binding universal stress UspA family protein
MTPEELAMPLRVKRVLWPTDFSDLSKHAARYAKAFRDEFGSELHVINVLTAPLPVEMSLTMPAELPVAVPEPELIEASKEALRRVIQEQLDGDENVRYEAFFGSPWSGVCEYARQNAIELIVVATHGRTGLQHAVIGSTAERIVQHAPCPVMVVKHPCQGFVPDDERDAGDSSEEDTSQNDQNS